MPSIFAGHYDPSFPIALCLKDLSLIDELMAETGVRNELTRATHDRFKEARDRYGEGAGEMTVCKVIEDAAGGLASRRGRLDQALGGQASERAIAP